MTLLKNEPEPVFLLCGLRNLKFSHLENTKGILFLGGRGVVVHSNGATINLDQIARGHHHKEEKERTNHK